MRRKRLAALGALAALALGIAAGADQPPRPGERGPRTGRAERLARFLGLSDQQQDQVRNILEERRPEHQALREKLETNRESMQQALEAANPDPTAVGELAIEAHRLHQQERALHEADGDAIRELLTAEQKVKFDAMRALREEGMGPHAGGGPHPRHGRGRGLP